MILRIIMTMALGLCLFGAQAASASHITTTLDAETTRPAAGSSITLALVMKPEADWHGYWENPGDAGIATDVAWTLPPGAAVGPLRHPVPQRLVVQGLMNYVYERPYALLVSLKLPDGLAPGTAIRISGLARWLACSPTICVPEQGPVAIDLVIGDGTVTPKARERFDAWRAHMPMPLAQPARFERRADAVRIAIPFPAERTVESPYFYPSVDGVIDYAAPQRISRAGDNLIVELKPSLSGKPAEAITGVLAIGENYGLSLRAVPGFVPAAGELVGEGARERGAPLLATMAIALGGAILGGLLLNVMPCVFPILSLKALSLARQGESDGAARREALAYGAGVILCCVALGGALLMLRAGGEAVGWAFQLQNPHMILALLLLVMVISLNLAGLFELGTLGLGEKLTKGGGLIPAFWTGALAAFVATPCTGPFMAGALGAALVLPMAAALAIFAGLGLGLALPFLLLGFLPALRRRLPRPGAWMDRLRRILSVPMFFTALGLVWILGRQAGVDGMTLGLALTLLIALSLWWTGTRQRGGRGLSWLPFSVALLVSAGALAFVPLAAPVAATAATGEKFDEQRLNSLNAERKPVLLYFTADWCLTCKVNEKTSIERAEVRKAFADNGVVTMVGDWTDGDPSIGRFLESHGRSGVPLYLFYGRDGKVQTLPQVLTPAMLIALSRG